MTLPLGIGGLKGLWLALGALLVLTTTACAPEYVSSGGRAGGAASTSTADRFPGDGSIPDNETISLSDNDHPAIANLDAELLAAVRKAAVDAQVRGIELRVTSGWRSKEYQLRLLDEAVAKYRSAEEARRWVHPPEKSKHVTGEAIDIGPTNAADWLIRNGADYGLCQAYANEMWHFELLTTPGGQCPQPANDPSS